ncbi:hypothetical protein KQ096_000944 [Salmonella enterica]|nr:hypothetical protein [Salmonella enterica]
MIVVKHYIDLNNLGGTPESIAKLYAAEVEQYIESEYSDSSVCVEIDIYGVCESFVIADSYELEDEITERIKYIERDVWDNGAWCNAA